MKDWTPSSLDISVVTFVVSSSYVAWSNYCPVIDFPIPPFLLKFISVQLVWTKCATHTLFCKQGLTMSQGINEQSYPSLSRPHSHSCAHFLTLAMPSSTLAKSSKGKKTIFVSITISRCTKREVSLYLLEQKHRETPTKESSAGRGKKTAEGNSGHLTGREVRNYEVP